MAVCRHSSILGRSSLPTLLSRCTIGFQTPSQHAADAVTELTASACSILHISDGHVAGGLIFSPMQHQQCRSKITNKTTTKSQKHHLHIPVKREAEIRKFWTEVRGVHDLACLHRFANFARVYPRYRDLQWLDVFMPQWDSAIERLIAHDMGMFPANQLARKHPFILNARIEPLQWAKMAVRGRLPAYAWKDVLNDIKKHTGAGDHVMRTTAQGNIAIDSVNKAWRSPNEPKAAAPNAEESGEVSISAAEEDEAWQETVNASAALSGKEAKAASKRLQSSSA